MEEGPKDSYHQGQQQHFYQEQLALRVAEIHGPPEAEALRDKHSRIVGIVVKEASRPVPIIIEETGEGRVTISRYVRFCPGTLSRQEADEKSSICSCVGASSSADTNDRATTGAATVWEDGNDARVYWLYWSGNHG